MHPPSEHLLPRLADCLIRDRAVLQRKLAALDRYDKLGHDTAHHYSQIERFIEQSIQRVEARRAQLPRLVFDEALPINQRQSDLKEALAAHPVIIVCGETGSGKTTQLPKLCLALGRGVYGLIGHTQPRRLAARAVASRLAHELGSPLGSHVGFKIRFTDAVSEQNVIKLMTDGILLAETQSDRLLTAYDTIIIDEAHERSLNIDFLLGYLKQLLPRRPDLKVIITSATIDAERFSKHFNSAPIIEVSGRTYPVDIHYCPLTEADEDEREIEMEEAIVHAAHQLARHGPGDILVFLPGEREIRETADQLRKTGPTGYEVLPLFARLSHEAQQRIFKPSGGRRIVLATNVAETSLTVPGIRYVIDTGLARVNRYNPRAKVEQLQIEKISQAAARQRAGRCGRTEAGICLRLYSEQDFVRRPAFTDPEIIRSNLAAVILRMSSLQLGSVVTFLFIDPPSQRLVADGYQVLHELGAIDEQQILTPIGKALARLPVDPRVGRMLLAAQSLGCLAEILIIAAGLTIQDPRERPADARDAADRAHARFADEHSDFLTLLKLWSFFDEAVRAKMSHRQRIALCHKHYLSWLRLREWRELHRQLAQLMHVPEHTALTYTPLAGQNDKARDALWYETIHKALLTGLISHIGMKAVNTEDYLSARGGRFLIAPGSGLKKAKPKWVVAAEIVETSRVYARCVARISPEWIEPLVPHLAKYHYSDARWEKKRGEVVANERVTVYGLTIVPHRSVSYGKIAPEAARELFIRGALVAMEYDSKARFFLHNRQLIHDIQALEHKARRQDVLVDDEALWSFYNEKIPNDVYDARRFEAWHKKIAGTEPDYLCMSKEVLMRHAASHVTEIQFPETFVHPVGPVKLYYRFEPGHPFDGVTADIPLMLLNRLTPEPFDWLVPGMIREKLSLILKAYPKDIRRLCVPVPDFVTRFLSSSPDLACALLPQLNEFIERETGMSSLPAAREIAGLPHHVVFNFRIVDELGHEIGSGRELNALQRQFGQTAQLSFREAANHFERDRVEQWDFGELPAALQFTQGNQQLTGYPALSCEKDRLALRLFDNETVAQHAHRTGVLFLLRHHLKTQVKTLHKGIPDLTQIGLALRRVAPLDDLLADAVDAICDRAFLGDDDLPRSEAAYTAQRARARARLPAVTQALTQILSQVAREYQALLTKLATHPLRDEGSAHLDTLVYAGFLSATPWEQLAHIPRYLQALNRRLEKYTANPPRDKQHAASVRALTETWRRTIDQCYASGCSPSTALLRFRWQLEELRVSLFAQELKTPFPVSVKRLQKQLSDVTQLMSS